MNPSHFVERRIHRLDEEVTTAARAFIAQPDHDHLDILLAAAAERETAKAALAAVEAADDRIYDSAGRWTGSHKAKHHTMPGALPQGEPRTQYPKVNWSR
jgi:hypothetical protein